MARVRWRPPGTGIAGPGRDRWARMSKFWVFLRPDGGTMYGAPAWQITAVASDASEFTDEDAVAFVLTVEEHIVTGSGLWVEY